MWINLWWEWKLIFDDSIHWRPRWGVRRLKTKIVVFFESTKKKVEITILFLKTIFDCLRLVWGRGCSPVTSKQSRTIKRLINRKINFHFCAWEKALQFSFLVEDPNEASKGYLYVWGAMKTQSRENKFFFNNNFCFNCNFGYLWSHKYIIH